MNTVPTPRIPPPLSELDRAFWTGGAAGELLIQFCDACRRWVHPPAPACPDCAGPVLARPVSGRGVVFTYTVNRHTFNADVPAPYVVAIVELVEQAGLRFTTNIVGCAPDDVHIGMHVQVRFEPAGDDAWAPVFSPAAAPAPLPI